MTTLAATPFLREARKGFHAALFDANILSMNSNGVPSIADKDSNASVAFAKGVLERLGEEVIGARLAGQMAGNRFEAVVGEYLEETIPRLGTLRPGCFTVTKGSSRLAIAESDQYSHLSSLSAAVKGNPELAIAIGMDYLIKPDVMVFRRPETDEVINAEGVIVDDGIANLTSIRSVNNKQPLLHASVSCKWTLRSDRAQNARSEALNLVRNRKGRLPHIVVVTGEPMPGRLASLAFGTGDIDCVYHIALPELIESVDNSNYDDSKDILKTMIEGKRLRDIADLPLDLAV